MAERPNDDFLGTRQPLPVSPDAEVGAKVEFGEYAWKTWLEVDTVVQ